MTSHILIVGLIAYLRCWVVAADAEAPTAGDVAKPNHASSSAPAPAAVDAGAALPHLRQFSTHLSSPFAALVCL